ncbi:hypothetical protein BRETT_002338 [Brettanomyces bruxellensis]|uniref:DNL-type domain-containing protein n=1 Tax=Dekkera bruxellensis TaxID=5007 RepID=A0A871RA93_DEKBR|nr:uncharacterized protein BRETT_002338 [Brettanomyces bruxellensis]QOU22166.1 hypothetical protein BRETT_002338 [Brettanomyces bruxellensis]
MFRVGRLVQTRVAVALVKKVLLNGVRRQIGNLKRVPTLNTSSKDDSKNGDRIKIDKPSLLLAFTCKKCGTRSSHIISKQAYLTGSVLVQCPGCKNRHLIADHLNIFHDGKINIEDILQAKGQNVSQNVSDLCFEDIPENLKPMLGRYAKDAPSSFKKVNKSKVETHTLPPSKKT